MESVGINTPALQKSHLLTFYWLFIRVYWGKKLKRLEFSSNLYEFSHNDDKDIIRTYNHGYFAYFGKHVVFEQKKSHLSKLLVFYRNNS